MSWALVTRPIALSGCVGPWWGEEAVLSHVVMDWYDRGPVRGLGLFSDVCLWGAGTLGHQAVGDLMPGTILLFSPLLRHR